MRTSRAVLLLAVLAHAASCGPDEVDVRAVNKASPGDYGRSKLIAANEAFGRNPRSPKAFAVFAAKVAELHSGFTEAVKLLAERMLVFNALGPMDAYADASTDEQLKVLGVTVWPTAFEIPAHQGETPAAYVERICGGPLALKCKYIVPEHRALVLSRYAWQQLSDRAGHALTDCLTCIYDPSWAKKVALYKKRADESLDRLVKDGGADNTRKYPVAGHNAEPWSDPPLFRYRDSASFDGHPLGNGPWAKALRARRDGRKVMGIYLQPGAHIALFRAIAKDAAAAGFDEVDLLCRQPDYPYEKRAYRIAIGRHAHGYKVRVRDVESIQILVQALDASAADHEPPFRI